MNAAVPHSGHLESAFSSPHPVEEKPRSPDNLPSPLGQTRPSLSTPPAEGAELTPLQQSERPLVIITDAWAPMVNGVVTRTKELKRGLEREGYPVRLITPSDFPHLSSDVIYPGLRFTIPVDLAKTVESLNPGRLLIMTEYTLGLAGRVFAHLQGIPYATAFTTNYCDVTPNYKWLLGMPKAYTDYLINNYLRWFHQDSDMVLVNSESNRQELIESGYPGKNLRVVGGAVDTQRFTPAKQEEDFFKGLKAPILLYVGRVSSEKRIHEFLAMDLPGTKVIVGEGPALGDLKSRYRQQNVRFMGRLKGEPLAKAYASADVFVFPSEFETLGRVLLEAMASGLTVAAKPVRGPIDIIRNDTPYGQVSFLNTDLHQAVIEAWEAVQAKQAEGSEAYQAYRENIHNYCKAYFSWQDYLPRFLESIPEIP